MQDIKAPEKMAADEVAGITETVQEQEEILNNADKLGSEYLQDKDALKKSINRSKRILARDAELVPKTAAERNKILAEVKHLEELIIHDIPTKREMAAKLGTSEAETAIRKNRAFHTKHNKNMLRLKHLKRCLDPDDPASGDLERIRPN